MKIYHLLVISGVMLLLSPQSLVSDTLWQQIPLDTLNCTGYACQEDSSYPFTADIADDIELSYETWYIDSITSWWHNWGGFISWDNVSAVRILVYQDSLRSDSVTHLPCDSSTYNLIIDSTQFAARNLSSEHWRLDINLDSVLVLNSFDTTIIYWLEILPVNSFAVNGLTGWMANIDIGNTRNFYIRYPLINILHWTSATDQFSANLETGFIIYGNRDVNGIEENQYNHPHHNLQVYWQKYCLMINVISNDYQELKLNIFDLSGRSVHPTDRVKLQPGVNLVSIPVENLPQGIYFTNIQINHQNHLVKFSVID